LQVGNANAARMPRIRLDLIERRGFTRYFGRAAIYGVTPIDEETVRKMLPSIDGSPGAARPYSLRDDY
jgi:hypothetical protein